MKLLWQEQLVVETVALMVPTLSYLWYGCGEKNYSLVWSMRLSNKYPVVLSRPWWSPVWES